MRAVWQLSFRVLTFFSLSFGLGHDSAPQIWRDLAGSHKSEATQAPIVIETSKDLVDLDTNINDTSRLVLDQNGTATVGGQAASASSGTTIDGSNALITETTEEKGVETDVTARLTVKAAVTTSLPITDSGVVAVGSMIVTDSVSVSPWITMTVAGGEVQGKVGPQAFCKTDYKVALYVYREKNGWYLQGGQDMIRITAQCGWRSGIDRSDEVAAHLVRAGEHYEEQLYIAGSCPPLAKERFLAKTCFPEASEKEKQP